VKQRPRRTPTAAMQRLTRSLVRLTRAGRPEAVVRGRAEVLLAYLASVPVAILIANDQARYVDANQHAVRLTGYTRRELTTMTLADLTPPPRHPLSRRLWRDFLRRGQMSGAYRLCRKNGSVVNARYLAVANVLPGVHVSALVPAPAVHPSTRGGRTTHRHRRRRVARRKA